MRIKIIKLFYVIIAFGLPVTSLQGQTTYGDTIFFENFGQHIIRATSPYMPASSYTFADPSLSMNAKEIQDNYYAVIDPRHIADATPSSYFWTSTSPYSSTPNGARPYYTADHTGNTNGAVMVVNAGTTVNYLYKRNVTLKTGFRYRFSFWIYLVARSSQFAMEVINSTNNTTNTILGPILVNEGVWTQYTLDFPVPLSANDTTNTVSVGLQNKYSLINGNDYYIDDILLSTLHTDPLSITILNNSPICQGPAINLIVNQLGGASPFNYSWKGPNEFISTVQNPTLLNSTSLLGGIYSLTITDAIGQTTTSTTQVVVNPIPKSGFTLSSNNIDNRHNSLTFNIIPEHGVNYEWKFGDGTTDNHPQITHYYNITGSTPEFIVSLIATDSIGCTSTTSQSIEVISFVPNVFSPNGDGINDVFMSGYDLKVFDRYGSLLYSGNSGWDGTYKNKKMDIDTYFYLLNYTDKYHQIQTHKGYITLKK